MPVSTECAAALLSFRYPSCMYMVTDSFLLVSRKRELLVSRANYRESSGSLYRKVATPRAIFIEQSFL